MRHLKVAGVMALLAVFSITGCGVESSTTAVVPLSKVAAQDKVNTIIPAPAGIVGMTNPDSNDFMYLAAGTARSKGLFSLNLITHEISSSSSISNAVDSATLLSSGIIVLGQATKHSGAISLYNAQTLKMMKTIPVGDPVIEVCTDPSEAGDVYVLNGTKKSETVSVVNTNNNKIMESIPVSLGTIDIASNAGTLYTLQPNGQIMGISERSKTPQFQFTVAPGARSFVVSPDGQTLYLLKEANDTYYISEVDLATESQIAALGAPMNAGFISLSSDSKTLYVGVESPSVGNVQTLQAIH
ncbi:YncE family protein [Sulfoacidibacillus ferrooxidans]|uniref:Uncharacterized protein n=1 Tax=Sulfoacidibacillus ferrooxidans TaxID=2005001 RepID=A0A9X1V8X4_9BACL|nr:hypothetical protein [Sulfoacidibacillus ferrooxidans]MCI0183419.1 hypothetical protein [Sulfoacidibacillus ferrooxidans]